jgi:hypothetical protein
MINIIIVVASISFTIQCIIWGDFFYLKNINKERGRYRRRFELSENDPEYEIDYYGPAGIMLDEMIREREEKKDRSLKKGTDAHAG